jgi:hypothetical protein
MQNGTDVNPGIHNATHVHHGPHRHRGHKLAAVAIIIVIIIGVAIAAGLRGGGTAINSSTALNLNQNPKVVVLNGHEYVIYAASTSPSQKTATLYIKSVPVFAGAAYSVFLSGNNPVHVNLDSAYSDLTLALESVNGSSAVVTATPVDLSLAIAPDSEYIQQLPQYLIGIPSSPQQYTQSTTTIPQSTTSNTAKSSTLTTTITSAPSSTTTIAQAQNITLEKIDTILKASPFYGVMQNYTAAYATANAKCDYESYNTAYSQNNGGAAPSGPASYYNMTNIVPYNMTMNITSLTHGNYSVNYYTKSHNPITTGLALQLKMNLSTSTIYSSDYSGAFQGLTTPSLESDYAVFSAKGVCGVYLV